MSGSRAALARPGDPATWAIVAAITVVGLVPRLIHFDGTYIGDELSTLYLVAGESLPDVISSVASNKEISPPLYFLLGWLFSQLGGAPELVRVPALIAGAATIPLTYMVGARALSRPAGLIAAAAMALNPFMVFYATDARSYTVAIALLLVTTLTMLIALESGRQRWWVGYAVATCLCMYTHYTTAFVLAAQLLWLTWAHREALRPALIANAGAALAFLPWLPSMLADFDSPTIEILSALQGDGFTVKRIAFESWAFGYPYNLPAQIPGRVPLAIGALGLLVGAGAALWRWHSPRVRAAGPRRPAVSRGMVLVLALALATPLAEAGILLLGGSDLLGARNLNTASGGFALSIGAIAAAAGPLLGAISASAVLAVFAIGTVKSLDPGNSTIDFRSAAEFIDSAAQPGDVVVDMLSPSISPVPLTSIDVYLEGDLDEYRLYLTEGPPPFLDFPPPARPILERGVRATGEGQRLFLVARQDTVSEDSAGRVSIDVPAANPTTPEAASVVRLPPGWRVIEMRSYDGLGPVEVFVVEPGAPSPGRS